MGIFRHTNTANPGPVTSPSFSARAYGPQSNPSATSISPEALQLTSPARVFGQAGDNRQTAQLSQSLPQPTQQYQQPALPFSTQVFPPPNTSSLLNSNLYAALPGSNPQFTGQSTSAPYNVNPQGGQYDMSHAFVNPEMPPIFPLTNEGIPYDAFEDDLYAFFRGDVPSYLDTFNNFSVSGQSTNSL